jgi:23S rRNA pseudouridine2457 synthase
MKNELKYFILYKPFGVLCQFTGRENRKTLAAFGPFPNDVYPVGRLDADSEGLILLTNDGALQHYLIEPKYNHQRTYLVQIENQPSQRAIEELRQGVVVEGRKTLPAEVSLLVGEPVLPSRFVPIRHRKNIPTAWIELTLSEGRNRQVRKMTATVGHPTLRLVRISIGPIKLDKLQPGESRELRLREIEELYRIVEIKKPVGF